MSDRLTTAASGGGWCGPHGGGRVFHSGTLKVYSKVYMSDRLTTAASGRGRGSHGGGETPGGACAGRHGGRGGSVPVPRPRQERRFGAGAGGQAGQGAAAGGHREGAQALPRAPPGHGPRPRRQTLLRR
eukprot:2879288-Pyramimonas_sp.AAC.1